MRDRPCSLLTWRWYLLVTTTYLIGLGSLAIALRHNLGFPLDDSWIHQEIARNLVQHHSFGFIPGVTSSGSSSTLWTIVLSFNYLLFANHSPVLFPFFINSFLFILSGLLIWHMAVLDGLPLLSALALAMLPALSGNYAWLVFIGMEHVLFVTLSLAAILAWFRDSGAAGNGVMGSSLTAGLILGALGMARPEGLALSVLLFALYKPCGRTLADVFRASGIALLFLVPSFVINLMTSGSLLPMTLRGRRFILIGSDKLHVGRSSVRSLTMDTYAKVIQHNFFFTTRGWAMVFVVLAFYGCFVLLRHFRSRTAILVLWAILHYASYCCTLPTTGQGGRYQPFVLLLFPPLLAIALLDLIALAFLPLKSLGKSLLQPTQTAALVVIAAITVATLPRWSVALRNSIYDIDNCHLKMAEYLNAHYPPGTKMGVFDIGTIGYFSQIDLIDLGGLVDRHYLAYWFSGRVPQYLQEKGAEFVILPHNQNDTRFGDQLGLLHNPALQLQEIHSEGIDYDTWHSSFLYVQHASQYQTLYRIVRLNPEAGSR